MNARLRLVLIGLPLVVLIYACSKSTTPATVSGKVTYKGEVVPGGIIYFHTLKEDGTPGANYRTLIQPDGTYVLAQLPDVDMLVTIDTESYNPNPAARPKMDPSKYAGAGKDKAGGGISDPKMMMEQIALSQELRKRLEAARSGK